MKALHKLCFLIHGFCYAEMANWNPSKRDDPRFQDYLSFENSRSIGWI
jgi:hypothetical protein